MFDIGMTELLVIGIVALIVVGPKDLPGMFRTLGRVTGKIKGMAREFQRAMDDAADDAGVKDISRDLKGMTSPKKFGLDKLDEAAKSFEKWQPGKSPSSSPKPAKPAAGATTGAASRASATAQASATAGERTTPSPAPAKDTGLSAETTLTRDPAAPKGDA